MKLKLPKIKRIRLRMTLYFTCIVIMVILVINFFTCLIFSNELVRQTDTVVQNKMHTIIRDIYVKIDTVRTLCSDIHSDEKIVNLLTPKGDDFKFDELTQRERTISSLLEKYASKNKLIDKIILVDVRGNILDPEIAIKESKNEILSDADFIAFSKSSYFENFSLSKFIPFVRNGYINNNEHYINYYNKFWDTNYNRLGNLIVSIDPNNFFNYTEVFCREIFDSAYIMNSKGELIYSVGPKIPLADMKSINIENKNTADSGIRTIDGKKYLVFNKAISYNTDWKLMGIISYEKLTQNVKTMSATIYTIGLLCIIVVIIASSYIAKSITNPIIKVNKVITSIDIGEWPEPIASKSEDELKHLVDGINRMVKNLKHSFNRIYEDEQDKKRAEIKALESQLDLLQSQINPHFIYNTLNTISYFALKNGDEKLREFIQSFNMLLRSSMSIESSFVTIAKELELTDNYLKIQKSRYGEIFQVFYDAPEDLLIYKIPKLILQPLVENSLFHGIAPKGTNGTVKVEFLKEDTLIRIKVIDDGIGICKENIPDILSGKRSMYTRGFNNIGLANINERLKLYFGEECTLKISSGMGIGTTVEFCIPYMT